MMMHLCHNLSEVPLLVRIQVVTIRYPISNKPSRNIFDFVEAKTPLVYRMGNAIEQCLTCASSFPKNPQSCRKCIFSLFCF